MGALWDAAYSAIEQLIEQNSCRISWPRYAQKDNGRGEMITDYDVPPETKTATVRIAHEGGGVQKNGVGPAGLTTNLTKYVVMLYDVDIRENDIITEDGGMKWKVGAVDPFSLEGEVYMKQAPLNRADGGQ